MTLANHPKLSDLVEREREILTRIARGGALKDVLHDLVLLAEAPSGGDMLASVLFLSPDGKQLLEGAAPSLPAEFNAAIHGARIGPKVGSCGTAAFLGQPVIVSDIASDPLWADYKELALKHDLRACWSMPIRAADGSVLGTFANYYREPKQPTERDVEIISMIARTTAIAIERHRSELDRQRADEQRMLLLRELNHRVKNVFALTSSLITISARSATSPQDLAASMQARLSALSRAHELVQPGLADGDDSNGSPVSFGAVLQEVLAPYISAGLRERIMVSGLDFELLPTAITSVALIMHELATNAMKYGCFQHPNGILAVTWETDGDMLHVEWQETGLVCDGPPVKVGFGSRLTKITVERQLQGAIRHEWRREGLDVHLDIPITQLRALAQT